MGRARKLHVTTANAAALRALLRDVADDECCCRVYQRAEPGYVCVTCRASAMLCASERSGVADTAGERSDG